ncbi:MAG TPA: VWA domain-containing protein, partial [Rugosimonospora sp.]|nr:VWA domain-containing protein [Rugosimonospora sp.]
DGWERGDPRPLGEAVHRLSRLAYRLIWVNPHAGRDGYEPLAGGMVAALPYLDDFVCGHSVAALADLVSVIGRP